MNVRNAAASAGVALALLLSSSCARRHASPAEQEQVRDLEDITVQIDNHNWADVLLYVVHDGTVTRFVEIAGARSASVTLPARLVGAGGVVRFIAHRIGGVDDYYSPEVSVRTGRTIALTLEGQLRMSSIGVW